MRRKSVRALLIHVFAAMSVLGPGSSLRVEANHLPYPHASDYCCVDANLEATYNAKTKKVRVTWRNPDLANLEVYYGVFLGNEIDSAGIVPDAIFAETKEESPATFDAYSRPKTFYAQVLFVCEGACYRVYGENHFYIYSEAVKISKSGSGGDELQAPEISVSIADRFTGRDGDKDGFVDYFLPTDQPPKPSLRIQEWRVTLKVEECGAGKGWTHTWTVTSPSNDTQTAEGCRYIYKAKEEDVHEVTVERTAGGGETSEAFDTFDIDDILIVSLGDSFGSGEGVPDKQGDCNLAGRCSPRPGWQSKQCHRSARSGFAKAAARVAQAFEKDGATVTFVHLACSGALADTGILNGYGGVEPDAGPPLPSQIEKMRSALGPRISDVDAVLMSAGGNDIGFADIIKACMFKNSIPTWGDECRPGVGDEIFAEKLRTLKSLYQAINAKFAELGLEDKIIITQYPDFTRDDTGDFCDGPAGFSSDEWEWAFGLLNQLNAAIHQIGWTTVTSHVNTFREHGYCARGHWMVQIKESRARQGNSDGAFHPNIAGQVAYSKAIYPVLANLISSPDD